MSQPYPKRDYFATTGRGLEPVLADELRRLGFRGVRQASGGAAFRGDKRAMIRACLALRTAHRVLWRLADFRAAGPDQLYRETRAALRWQGLIPPDRSLAVSASVRSSRIRDSRFAALKVKDAIVDAVRQAVGARPDVAPHDPDVRVFVRLHRDRATLSLDAAGTSLHARGYRTEATQAPLRETLAAGLVLRSGWRGDEPLLDPMCGSGTIPIEAALIAGRIAPGLLGRRFGFERWPGHRPRLLSDVRTELEAARRRPPADILGSDQDTQAIALARSNAERAGVADAIGWSVADARGAGRVGRPGVILCNPPYGHRLGDARELVAFYRRLGQTLRERFAGWRAWLVLGEESHVEALGLPIAKSWRFANGPLDVEAVEVVLAR